MNKKLGLLLLPLVPLSAIGIVEVAKAITKPADEQPAMCVMQPQRPEPAPRIAPQPAPSPQSAPVA